MSYFNTDYNYCDDSDDYYNDFEDCEHDFMTDEM